MSRHYLQEFLYQVCVILLFQLCVLGGHTVWKFHCYMWPEQQHRKYLKLLYFTRVLASQYSVNNRQSTHSVYKNMCFSSPTWFSLIVTHYHGDCSFWLPRLWSVMKETCRRIKVGIFVCQMCTWMVIDQILNTVTNICCSKDSCSLLFRFCHLKIDF